MRIQRVSLQGYVAPLHPHLLWQNFADRIDGLMISLTAQKSSAGFSVKVLGDCGDQLSTLELPKARAVFAEISC